MLRWIELVFWKIFKWFCIIKCWTKYSYFYWQVGKILLLAQKGLKSSLLTYITRKIQYHLISFQCIYILRNWNFSLDFVQDLQVSSKNFFHLMFPTKREIYFYLATAIRCRIMYITLRTCSYIPMRGLLSQYSTFGFLSVFCSGYFQDETA